jgi:flagellar hook-associated protein 1
MSLSGALSNAMSGLTANARSTTIISSNIANALNENYGRRSVTLGTNATQSSGGVQVTAVSRYSDPVLAHQKRLAAAEWGQSRVFAEYTSGLERIWGSVDTTGSVANKLTRFEASLFSTAADPSSETRLRTVALDAEAFATSIRSASEGLQQMRTQADGQIATLVEKMNVGLGRIERLNDQIITAKHLGLDTLGLQDQRDAELETLSEIVPLHVIERDTGAVAVFSKRGMSLLDGHAVELSFQHQPLVQPHMTISNSLLSGLRMNGNPVETALDGSLAGGTLAAQFEIRDSTAVKAQTRLDGLARDLIDRFGPAGPDATILAGDSGIFTDAGTPFLTINETGIAGRLELNDNLKPSSPELWRWRDGLNATAPGDVGSSDLILLLQSQISTAALPNSLILGSSPRSFSDHIQVFANDVAADRVRAQASNEIASTQFGALKEQAATNGVNSDQELQKLIELEKSYAANARVVRVVDDMLSELLRI